MDNILKILIIGLGSIGKRHCQILKNLNDCGVLDIELQHFTGWDSVNHADIAFICNPTHLHIDTAIECAKRDMHLFIEKPIDCKLDKLDDLLKLVEKNKLTTYVAYPFRHHHKIRELRKTYKNQWLYFVCHTDFEKWRPYKTYSHVKNQGGGCLLELSHEIDLAQFLLGKIKSITNSLPTIFDATLDLDTECWLRIEHDNKNLSFHNLNIKKSVEQRFLKFKGGEKIKYIATEDMYERQIKYFFDNLDNPNIENNIFEAADLFKRLMELRKQHSI